MNTQESISTSSSEVIHPQIKYYYYLDNLRALALMVGVFFHAALAYSLYMNEFWITAAPQKSTFMEAAAFFSHLFRMPLFMLIAGFFGNYLYQKRGLKGFIKNRSVRILAPFAVFFPVVLASYVGVFMYAMKHVEQKSPLLQLVSTFATNPSARLNMQFSTMHLWFLYNLILFYCVTILVLKVNVFDIKTWLLKCSTRKVCGMLLLAFPIILIPSFYLQYALPITMPDKISPQLWSFGFFGIFFAMGWILFSSQYLLDTISKYWKPMLVISLIAFAILYQLYPRTITLAAAIDPKNYVVDPLIRISSAIFQGFISVYMVFVLLILGKKFLNSENAFFRYMSQSSYWVYLVHVPIVLFIQVVLTDKDWNLWLKYFITVALTFIISLLSYQLLVRYTPIGWMLNGRKNDINKN